MPNFRIPAGLRFNADDDPIHSKWLSLGGRESSLRNSCSNKAPTADGIGFYRNYENGGKILWSPETGAHAIEGEFLDKWIETGLETGALGYPISDREKNLGDDHYHQHFQHGSIYQHRVIQPPPPPGQPKQPDIVPIAIHGPNPRFIFDLETIDIRHIRSPSKDTVHIYFNVNIGDQNYGKYCFMGDLETGRYHPENPRLHIGPLEVADPTTPVVVSYQIFNLDSKENNEIREKLKDNAHKLAAMAMTSGSVWAAIAAGPAAFLLDLTLASCDGPLAVDQFACTAGVWNDEITATAWLFKGEHTVYPGLDSPMICGSNSEYAVRFGVSVEKF